MRARDRAEVKRVFALTTVTFFVVIGARLGEAYQRPTPLPDATVDMRDGTVVIGALVVARPDAIWLSSREDVLESVQASQTLRVQVMSRPRPEPKSFFESVRDFFD